MKLFELHNDFDLEKFESDCKPFLRAMRGAFNVAYHGSHDTPDTFEIREFKERTKARDTDAEIHGAANEYFQAKFGFPFRNGLFVTGLYKQAAIYGKRAVIFPIGEFEFLWSPKVEDLTGHLENYVSEAKRVHGIEGAAEQIEYANERFIGELTNHQLGYINGDLKEALDSNNEIMLRCKSFYIFNAMEDPFWGIIRKFLVDKGYKR